VLKGKITDMDTGTVILRMVPENRALYDTTTLQNGRFKFKGVLNEPVIATLKVGDRKEQLEVFLEPAKMRIKIDTAHLKSFLMTGSKTQKEAFKLEQLTQSYYKSRETLHLERMQIYDSIKNSDDERKVSQWNKEYDSLNWLMDSIKIIIDSVSVEFVQQHPKSFLSPYRLFFLTGSEYCSYSVSKSTFDRLDTSVKTSKFGKMMQDELRKMGNTQVGVSAPNFIATDLMNRTITLNQFKGNKVVLLDFWASWCIPCRENYPHLKLLYDKFNPKGLEIICISVDYNKSSWIKAVSEEQIEDWFNIWVAQNFSGGPSQMTENDVYSNYYYNTIPQTILINKDGIIEAIWIGASPENNDSLEKHLSRLLN
jgi:peroxiredoxin